MWNRYWNFTTCINYTDINTIKHNIITLFERQGANFIDPTVTLLESLQNVPKQHPAEQSSSIWIVALYPGKNKWTIVKTYPSELLCHSVVDDYEYYSQLSALTFQLKCDAFHLSVHGDTCGFLVEADSKGKNYITGSFFNKTTNPDFYRQPIQIRGQIKKFSLLKMPPDLEKALAVNQSPKLKQKLIEINKSITDNPELEFDLDFSDELDRGYTERIDLALKNVMDNTKRWYVNNLFHLIDNESLNIDIRDTSLLYFEPPIGYKASVLEANTEEKFGFSDVTPEFKFDEYS